MSRKRWIFILAIVIKNWSWKSVKEVGSGRRHKCQIRLIGQRWHKCQVRLVDQDIFIKFNIPSNDYIMIMWLKKSITFYIFKISNKYVLFTFRLQCFSFFIRNVSPCFTTKHMEVTYIWFNFNPCFFRCYTLSNFSGCVINYLICTIYGIIPILKT